MRYIKEILQKPRWDQKEFELLKIKAIEDITNQKEIQTLLHTVKMLN